MGKRMPKVNSLIKRELSIIIQQELKDPRIGFVTVTAVEVAKDLRHAKVHCSVMGDDKDRERTIESLKSARRYMQNLLNDRIVMKYIPELHFFLDTSLDHSMHIEDVLKKIKEEDERRERERPADN